MRYAIILLLLLTSCSTIKTIDKVDQLATPAEVAQIKIKPNLDLPPPLDLNAYKIDETKVKQYKDGEQIYIALPEQDMEKQNELLLILKTRLLELQRIIVDAKKLL